MSSIFTSLYHTLKSRSILVGFCIMTLVVGCLYIAKHINFNEDVSALLPIDAKTAQLQKVIKAASFNDKVIVMFQKNDTSSKSNLIAATKAFIKNIKASDSVFIKQIQAGFNYDDFSNVQNLVFENLPLFLDKEDYEGLNTTLEPSSIKQRLRDIKSKLQSPIGAITERGYRKDPFKLSIEALKGFKDLQLESNLISEEGILINTEGTTSMVFIDLAISSQDGKQSAAFANFLEDRLSHNSKNYPQISVSAIGGVLYNVSNADQIKQDILITLSIAVSILLLALMLFFKSIRIPLLLFLPTLCSAAIALAILAIWKTQVSAIALGIGSILLGITLDYALHVLTHLRNSATIEEVYKSVTKPILLSGSTTAVAFLCLLFVGSEALATLGVFAAISVALSSILALLLIPIYYNVENRQKTQNTIIDAIARQDFHKNRIAFVLLFIACIGSVFLVSEVKFSTDLNQLNYETPALADAKAQLDALTNRKYKTSLYLVSYANLKDDALLYNTRVWQKLKHLEDSIDISFSSIGGMVLSREEQYDRIDTWNQFWKPQRLTNHRATIARIAKDVGFSDNAFMPWQNHIKKDFNVLDYESVTIPNLSLDNFISEKDGLFTVTTPVTIKTDAVSILEKSMSKLPQVAVINRTALNEGLLGRLANTFNNLLWFSILGVFIMMFVVFRSVWLSLLTLLPIALSWLLTLGVMVLFGLQFNVFNIIICSFIFGLGVDFSIFMTNGVVFKNKNPRTLISYRTSILLSVMTTLLGMGALVFAKHPALQSVAAVSIIGVVSALLVSFIVHPFILHYYLKFRSTSDA